MWGGGDAQRLSNVGEYLNRFAASGLTWPSALTDAELHRPGVTLALLWQEYLLAHPQGFQYSWFCEHYRLWAAKIDMVMRQEHRAGEKLFVDYAGQSKAGASCAKKSGYAFLRAAEKNQGWPASRSNETRHARPQAVATRP